MTLPLALVQALPAGSRLTERADGFIVTLPGLGALHVRERCAPLCSALRIARALAPTGAPTVTSVLTSEGEYAALVPQVPLGIVYGDDHYRMIIGVPGAGSAQPALATLVERVTRELPMGLARQRRRWFRYVPPAGWSSRARHGLITEWYPPGFPDDRAILTVFAARPTSESAAGEYDRSLFELPWTGYRAGSIDGPPPIATRELGGVGYRVEGAWGDGVATTTRVALLADSAFSYLARLDHDGRDPVARDGIFMTLVDSIERIPTTLTELPPEETR